MLLDDVFAHKFIIKVLFHHSEHFDVEATFTQKLVGERSRHAALFIFTVQCFYDYLLYDFTTVLA